MARALPCASAEQPNATPTSETTTMNSAADSRRKVSFCNQVLVHQAVIEAVSHGKEDCSSAKDNFWYTRSELANFRTCVRRDCVRLLGGNLVSGGGEGTACTTLPPPSPSSQATWIVPDDDDDDDDDDDENDSSSSFSSSENSTDNCTPTGLDAYANVQRCAQRFMAKRIILKCHRKLSQTFPPFGGVTTTTTTTSSSLLLSKVSQRISTRAKRTARDEGLCNYCEVYPERAMVDSVDTGIWNDYTRILRRKHMERHVLRQNYRRLCLQHQQQQQQQEAVAAAMQLQRQHQQQQQDEGEAAVVATVRDYGVVVDDDESNTTTRSLSPPLPLPVLPAPPSRAAIAATVKWWTKRRPDNEESDGEGDDDDDNDDIMMNPTTSAAAAACVLSLRPSMLSGQSQGPTRKRPRRGGDGQYILRLKRKRAAAAAAAQEANNVCDKKDSNNFCNDTVRPNKRLCSA